jgi:hypothetical protein
MKKSAIIFGLVLSIAFLTSCTTDDFDQEINNSNVQFEEEMSQDLYQRDGDTIVTPIVNTVTSTVVGDPIVKPKNG